MGGVVDYIGVKNILYVVLQIGEKSFSSVIFEAKGIKKKKISSSLRLILDLFDWYSQHRYAVYTLFSKQMCQFG